MRDQSFLPILHWRPVRELRRDLVIFMVCFAYDCKNPSKQLTGLPNWAKSQSYAVAAKPAPGFTARFRLTKIGSRCASCCVQLAGRFHLQLHTETRQEGHRDKLELAKSGIEA